jgi:hypothetical protein
VLFSFFLIFVNCVGKFQKPVRRPKFWGCLINIDSDVFGHLITDKDSKIKIVMVEYKYVVCEILRAMIAEPDVPSE